MGEKYYSYKGTIVLNDAGYQCDVNTYGEIYSRNIMFTDTEVLSPNFINGTIDILSCEVGCGQINSTQFKKTLCQMSELFEVSEVEAREIITSQIDTISKYKNLITNIEEK